KSRPNTEDEHDIDVEEDIPLAVAPPIGSLPILPPPLSEFSSDFDFVAIVTADKTVWVPPSGSTFKIGGPSSISSPYHTSWGISIETHQTEIAITRTGVDRVQRRMDAFDVNIAFVEQASIRKIEQELWNLTIKGDDIDGYTDHLHELFVMCPTLVTPNDSNKRKWEDHHKGNNNKNRNNTHHHQQDRRLEAAKAYVVDPSEGKIYVGNLPLCNKCKLHHNVTCYGCEGKGYYKRKCPNKKNQQDGGAHGRAYVMRTREPQQDPNVVTDTSYDVELADGKIESINTVLKKEQEEHLKTILKLLKKDHLYAKFSKCKLWMNSIQFLGHVIDNQGLAGYYRRFIERFSVIAKPLTKLTQKNKKYEWGEELEEEFQLLKQKLYSSPILALPEGNKDFMVYCDASLNSLEIMIITGADNRPSMLEKSLYDSWKSRMEHYIENKENRKMILNSVQNGLLIWPTIIEEDGTTRTKKCEELSATEKIQDHYNCKATNIVLQDGTTRTKKYEEPSSTEKIQAGCDCKATNNVLQEDGTTRTNKCEELSATEKIQDHYNCKATNIVLQVLPPDGKTLYQYYWRFSQLINNMNVINMSLRPVQVNTKFFNSLSPAWRDDPITYLNKAMHFLTAIASSRFHSTNIQLRTSSNPKTQATIQDGRVTVQQVQGRQGQSYAGNSYNGNATSSGGNNAGRQARVFKCYNYQCEGHMARQCTQPKKARNDTWFKEKAMLAEALEAGQILEEEQLAFLADPGIPDGQAAQTTILNTAAFQTIDLDAYDSDCDDVSNAKAVLIANLYSYGSDVIS
nr:reverse transcriptase domain-containing protein [Tanacetum cinerariifolium]